MVRRPPRSTRKESSAASDVYKRQLPIVFLDNSLCNLASLFNDFLRYLGFSINSPQLAVSYTHLRAHETRHDLVCRLLLEKKKNSAKQQPIYIHRQC
ncbi:hypothetical protein CDFC105_43987 [Clostridioides difficile]|nr:hypothetical protein CDFC105_43987 [Clostridioides difficile]